MDWILLSKFRNFHLYFLLDIQMELRTPWIASNLQISTSIPERNRNHVRKVSRLNPSRSLRSLREKFLKDPDQFVNSLYVISSDNGNPGQDRISLGFPELKLSTLCQHSLFPGIVKSSNGRNGHSPIETITYSEHSVDIQTIPLSNAQIEITQFLELNSLEPSRRQSVMYSVQPLQQLQSQPLSRGSDHGAPTRPLQIPFRPAMHSSSRSSPMPAPSQVRQPGSMIASRSHRAIHRDLPPDFPTQEDSNPDTPVTNLEYQGYRLPPIGQPARMRADSRQRYRPVILADRFAYSLLVSFVCSRHRNMITPLILAGECENAPGIGVVLTEHSQIGRLDRLSPVRFRTGFSLQQRTLVDSRIVDMEIMKGKYMLSILGQVINTLEHLAAECDYAGATIASDFYVDESLDSIETISRIPIPTENLGIKLSIPECGIFRTPETSSGHYWVYPIQERLSPRQGASDLFITDETMVLPTNFNPTMLAKIQVEGHDLKGLDVYTALISILLIPTFYYSIMNTEFEAIYRALFFPEDWSRFSNKIRIAIGAKTLSTRTDVLDLLSRSRIKRKPWRDIWTAYRGAEILINNPGRSAGTIGNITPVISPGRSESSSPEERRIRLPIRPVYPRY